MIATAYSLDKRLELFLPEDRDPISANKLKLARIVSYDNGSTWINNWAKNDVGVMSSSPAAAITGDSLDCFVVSRGQDDRFWLSRLSEYYELKNLGWNAIGSGVFNGRPAICVSGNTTTKWDANGGDDKRTTSYAGVKVHVFGKGMDNRIWRAFSGNGGSTWDLAWAAIGEGTFKSSPAAVCSADAQFVAVFGQGMDNKIWWAYSTSGGSKWDMAWKPIGAGVFETFPAAACSADGKRLYVFGRGNDNRMWWAYSTNRGQSWDMAWSPIGEGVFTSGPSACTNWEGKHIHVFGLGNDSKVWQARSDNFGQSWNIAWRKVNDKIFKDIKL